MIAGFTSTGLLIQHMIFGHLLSGKNGKRVKLMGTAKTNKDDLIILKNLLGSGKIKSVIDRTYPMNEITEAVRYLEKGHSKGKVVITL
jgi:D-arabinose 1-dehydrogenase-like Zn-dependent alcohol dehydrogenase